MAQSNMKKPLNPVVASFLMLPGILIVIHLGLMIGMLRSPSFIGQDSGELIIELALWLTPIALVCGVWALIYSSVRFAKALFRYIFVAANVLSVGIALWYVYAIFCFMAIVRNPH